MASDRELFELRNGRVIMDEELSEKMYIIKSCHPEKADETSSGFEWSEMGMANLFGITSPANFIFLAIIALLCEKLLTVTIKLSQLEEKVEIMAAEIAIRTQKTEQKEQELRSRGGNNEGIADSDHV